MDLLDRTVFRLRRLPSTTDTFDDAVSLINRVLGPHTTKSDRIFSLASSLYLHDDPQSKVATALFLTRPSCVANDPSADEWLIPFPPGDLILDTHFRGMTPLNDVDRMNHSYYCIAISGLASHPFGSWQPRGHDKSFMWIRDNLPKHRPDVRAILYGYDTKLKDSQSFQDITDLALGLIRQLQACGCDHISSKPIAFLAHSLGGLVLKDALVQLAKGQDIAYKALANKIRGAVFFGVPNLGMEQAHLRSIVQNNPNEKLLDDIARNSNYLRQLNEAFITNSSLNKFRCYWAYETVQSPTIVRTSDGKIDRDGPPAILVSRESATCRSDLSLTIPINATHSEMVKFAKGSEDYQNVMIMLSRILPLYVESETVGSDTQTESQQIVLVDRTVPSRLAQGTEVRTIQTSTQYEVNLRAELDRFKQTTELTIGEEVECKSATYETVRLFLHGLQHEQAAKGNLMYLRRLEPFLDAMQEFQKVFESFDSTPDKSGTSCQLSPGTPEVMGFIWGSLKIILTTANTLSSALHSVLDAYQDIGEQIPLCTSFIGSFSTNPQLREGFVMTYRDILGFQQEIMQQLRQRQWQRVFMISWMDFNSRIQHIKQNLERNKRLIESRASLGEYEQVNNSRITAMNNFQREREAEDAFRRRTVFQWLSPFDNNAEQERFQQTRSICKSPGRWLFEHPEFQKWFHPQNRSMPCLWLSGIPGAGKTILASVIVDEVRKSPIANAVYFYCRYKEDTRNSFLSVARSMLAQMLVQKPRLLPHLHEKAAWDSKPLLQSIQTAEHLLTIGFGYYEQLYIIIDGLDECEQAERRKIADWFQTALEALPIDESYSVRCLFTSQSDGIALKSFAYLTPIQIQEHNRNDLAEFATVWHDKIEQKFGELRSNGIKISQILVARAQGMFIFAELFAKYLESQSNRGDLLKELDENKLPVMLDQVYERILSRIVEMRSKHTLNYVWRILGWTVCAKRPLKWREIQGAICIDLDNQCLDYNQKILDSPKGLFASLIELKADGTVQLVHLTAREYLLSKGFVSDKEVHYSLSMLSLAYLSFSQISVERSKQDIKLDLVEGVHAFYDYASACWVMHLVSGLPESQNVESLADLQETLETFIELHWSNTHKPLHDVKRVQELLISVKSFDAYEKIVQAVAWARKQGGERGQGPNADEALDLTEFTKRMRSVLEDMLYLSPSNDDARTLHRFYGGNWYKCPRINCNRYHNGFQSAKERNLHIQKHERPFLCYIRGCHVGVFGCVTEDELRKHLFDFHGINRLNETEESEFPDLQKARARNIPTIDAAKFTCELCEKRFTRKHNLNNHMRTHEGTRPFPCTVCDERFTRKTDRDRHEHNIHGEKQLKCHGILKDGTSWGCERPFGRRDKLRDHYNSKTGRACIYPLLLEEQNERSRTVSEEDHNVFANVKGENGDVLRELGKSLPSFEEFLQMSGIDRPE